MIHTLLAPLQSMVRGQGRAEQLEDHGLEEIPQDVSNWPTYSPGIWPSWLTKSTISVISMEVRWYDAYVLVSPGGRIS